MRLRLCFVLTALAALVVLQSCQAAEPQREPLAAVPTGAYSGGDGTTFENAVVINAASDRSATSTEYAWLQDHFPGAKRTRQSLRSHGQHVFDVLEAVLIDGSTQSFYFDIFASFGKR